MELPFLSESENAKATETRDRIHNQFLNIFNIKYIIPLFAGVVVLLLLVSMFVVHHEKKEQESTTDTSLSEQLPLTSQTASESMEANILVAYIDSTEKQIRMLGVLNINSEEKTAEIQYLEPSSSIKVNNYDGTMQQHYENGGVSELLWAVREYLVVQIDRYIVTDDDNFTKAAKLLGECEITIDESVNYNYKGINFIIEKGPQKLTADMLQKYFTYLCDAAYSGGEQQLSDMLSFLFTKFLRTDEETTIEDLYEDIVDYINTDISVMDLNDYSAAAYALMEDSGEFKISTK